MESCLSTALRTVTREAYGPGVRLLDHLCRGLSALGTPLGDLDPDGLITAARRRCRLDDLGDPAFLPRLRRVTESLERAPVTALARAITRQTFITALANRLRHEDWMRRHPAAEHRPIQRPVFILGFPRTGTTLLQNLLSLEEGSRALRFWELQTPVPVSEDRARDRARRLRIARSTLAAAYLIAPEMRTVHEIGPETAEECWPLFANSFAVMNWELGSGLLDYGQWLREQDMTGPYREYRRQLQMIATAQDVRQLVLKCPEHLWFVDALLAVFPDAAIVWTHRDPLDSVASYCSLISLNRRLMYGRVEPKALGAHIQQAFADGVRRAMAARDRHPGALFLDVDFRALVRDTPGQVRALRERLDLPHDAAAEARVQAWLADNGRQDRKGSHLYDPAHYGLEAGSLYPAFQDYIERFGIPVRGARGAA